MSLKISKFLDCCQFFGCSNKRSEGVKLFLFPAEADGRLEVWIKSSGNEAFLRKRRPSVLRKAGFCADHFYPESFWNNTKSRLKPNQNPIPYRNMSTEEEEIEKRQQEVTQKRIQEEMQRRIREETQKMQVKTEVIIKEEIIVEEQGENGIEKEETANRETGIGEDIAGGFAEISEDENEIHVNRTKVLKTYPAAAKKNKFITLNQENDKMEWSKMEPSLPSTSFETAGQSTLTDEERIQNFQRGLSNKLKKLKKDDEAAIRKMSKKIQSLQQKLKAQRLEHKRHMNAMKRRKISISEFMNAHHCFNPVSRAIVTMQLRRENDTCYNKDEKDFAKRLNFHSATLYKHLRKAGLKLPSQSTVRRWISEYDKNLEVSETNHAKFKKVDQLPQR